MLEQRRAEDRGYITLKEAAKISNYAPDYIGQLIRTGKIKGEQVYSNVAWVTTETEIRTYLDNRAKGVREVSSGDSKAPEELLSYGTNLFKYILYGLIGVLAVILLAMQYILYVSLDNSIGERFQSVASAEIGR